MRENTWNLRKICTWNVRSMFEGGKIHNTIQEMERLKIDVMGISEMRWQGTGRCCVGEHVVYYSGNDEPHHWNGVAVILNKRAANAVISVLPLSDRIIMVKLHGSPININILQIYAPTMDKPDEEIEEFYASIQKALRSTKKNELTIITGDFNAKVGKGRIEDIVGEHGLGDKNERGDRLIQFCREEDFTIANTWFKLPNRRLYTWKSPADTVDHVIRNQIDYILINKRFKNSLTSAKTYPGADVFSDHNPLVGQIELKLKKVAKTKHKENLDYDTLKDPIVREEVRKTMREKLETTTQQEQSVEQKWSYIKDVVIKAGEKHLRKRTTEKYKEWMTDDILHMMDQRRLVKNKDERKYKEINRTIRREVRRAKEARMKEKCSEIEELQAKHDHTNIHRKIREATGRYKKRAITPLMDKDENLVTTVEDKMAVWKLYIEELFRDGRGHPPETNCVTGPSILESEVKAALIQPKNGKATGPDGIPAELLKVMGEVSPKELTELFNVIYNSGYIPEEWLMSTFVPLPKKPSAKKCEEFRTISLMNHVLKIFLKIIHSRIYKKCEENMGEMQFGFRNALGTREALFTLQVLIQRCRDVSCDVYICFIDYAKAFDRCQHHKMISALQKLGIDDKDIRLITNLYWNQSAQVKVEDQLTDQVKIMRGVRQGCVLSPILFNIYSEEIFAEALTNLELGIRINGEFINNLRYADDTVLLATSLEDLQILIDRVRNASLRYGLDLNIRKTKFMVISRANIDPGALMAGNEEIERVDKLVYLGTILNSQWDHTAEIRSRIEIARSTCIRMRSLLYCNDLSLDTKMRIVRCYIFPVLLYGVEAWTLTQAAEKKIEAFEMWIYRRILKISYVDHITNVEVMQRMRKEKEILATVKQRKLEYFGHVMRNEQKYRILQLTMQGKIFGKRGPGRRRISWLKNLRQWFGMTSSELFRRAVNKTMIALMIANIRNG